MTIHDQRYPNESSAYRASRDELLSAEIELRQQIEHVAGLRRNLPPGGLAPDYQFATQSGERSLCELFGDHETLIVYSFMFGGTQEHPCPMCSAFIDSVNGQVQHIEQRAGFVVVARAELGALQRLAAAKGWQNVAWVSAADNSYPVDYLSEMPNGAQVPMCNVFTRSGREVRHFWGAEMFFAPGDTQPRHIDLMWPLWNFFDITPEGRGEFMPRLNY